MSHGIVIGSYKPTFNCDSGPSWSKTSDQFSFQAAERASIVGYKEEDLAVPPEIPRPIPEVRESYPLWFASITFPC